MKCRQSARSSQCAGRKCRSAPCHAAAQTTLEQMNLFHLLLWHLLCRAPGRSRQREGGRVGGRDEEWQEEWDVRDRKRKMIELKMEGGGKESPAGWF